MKKLKRVTRHDAADPDFIRRAQLAFVTAGQAEQALTGAVAMTDADAARLRMLSRKGLLADSDSAEAARRRMIARRERKSE